MRKLFVLVFFLTACSNQPSAATSPSPSSPTAPPTPTPSPTPTPTISSTPTPIALPSFAQISAPSGAVVWALVAGQRLFRSTDGGDTWAERSFPGQLPNVEVAFASDTDGLLISPGSPGTQCLFQSVRVWRTTDGAASWKQVPASGIADGLCKGGLTSADMTHALFTAWSPNAAPVTYRTADAGQTWTTSIPFPDPPGQTSQPAGLQLRPGRPSAFGAIVLADAVFGSQPTRYIYRSTDSGATWRLASTAPSFEGTVAFVTAVRWLQIAPPSSSKETTDGGASWHAYTSDYSQAAPIAPEVVFGDAMVGYATVRGSIQRTVDGGAHWSAIKTPGTG